MIYILIILWPKPYEHSTKYNYLIITAIAWTKEDNLSVNWFNTTNLWSKGGLSFNCSSDL